MPRADLVSGFLVLIGVCLLAPAASAQLPPSCEMSCWSKPDSLYQFPSKTEQRECRRLGKRDARRDVERDSLVHKVWGHPLPWSEAYPRLMKKRYGVTVEFVAADVVCKRATSYWNGYNDVSTSEIESRFGECVIDSTREHAREIFPDQRMVNPEVFKNVQHTAEARRDSVEGVVIVSFDVTASGVTKNLRIQQGLGHGLDEKALDAVRRLRFQSNVEKDTVYNVKNDTIIDNIDESTILWEMAVPVEFFFSKQD